MQNTNLILVLGALLLGAGLGYSLAMNSVPKDMHRMPDGTLMSNTLPESTMEHSMDSMMANLEGKKGDAFDKAFLEEMIIHHEGAVDMAEALLQNTARPELQKLGKDIITAQTGEIEMMRGWLLEWFPK